MSPVLLLLMLEEEEYLCLELGLNMSDWEHREEDTDSWLPRNDDLMEEVLAGGGTGAAVLDTLDSLRVLLGAWNDDRDMGASS